VVETQVANEDEIPMGRGEMVLVVEDEASILKLADRVLSNLNYRVLTATSPTESLEMAKARAEEISLLITDVVMPEMNGRELADQIKAICPDIQCLFMSGYPANVIAQRGVLDRGLDFIQKPFSKMELATKVRRALDS
jgi:CheY-like chemotaxis protein